MFDQIQQAEQSGNLSPEEKKRLEEQAAEKGLHALFKVRLFPSPLAFSAARRRSYLIDTRMYVRLLSTGHQTGDRLGVARDV